MADQYTGAMIALLPSVEDAQRLAVDGGEPAEQLHLTLWYLGDAGEIPADTREALVNTVRSMVERRELPQVHAHAFGANLWNPDSDQPAWVLAVGDLPDGREGLAVVKEMMSEAWHDGMVLLDVPAQHTPWVPHVSVAYTGDPDFLKEAAGRVGPIVFDRVRVAFAGDYYDVALNTGRARVTAMDELTAAVNSTAWKKMPIAARETTFSADDAIVRIADWAGGSVDKFSSAFLWRNSQGPANNKNSYRLPIADVVNGRLVMIPRAVFAAAAILSGAHGGLAGVVGDEEKKRLKGVVTDIYDVLREQYGDPRTIPPWLRGGNEREDVTASVVGRGEWTMEEFDNTITASVNTSGWDSMPVADDDRGWDSAAARARVFEWAGGDFRKYRRAFLWYDAQNPEVKGSYKLPVADVVDGELTIVPRAVNAVAAVLGGARGGVDIPDADMDRVQAVVNRIQRRIRGDEDDSVTASAPVHPPSSAFQPKRVTGPTPFTITADGSEAYGHLWLWNKCHAGIQNECVMAPHSATGYRYFHNGQVLTADGQLVKVGKITMGTGHAGPRQGWIPAADHYDNTGTVAAIVHVTEDEWGGFAAGVPVSSLTDEQVQELRRSPISGDWRRINGNLELVAALAVNTPGFPIVASLNGEVDAIIAAGVLMSDGTVAHEYGTPVDTGMISSAERRADEILDSLDAKITALRAHGRARIFDRVTTSLDRRRS